LRAVAASWLIAGPAAARTALGRWSTSDFLSHQLYHMAEYLYRVSGQEGDPANRPTRPTSRPQLNGWQRFLT